MGWIKDIYDILFDLGSRLSAKKRKQLEERRKAEDLELKKKRAGQIASANTRAFTKRPNWIMRWKQ
jgi:hypothetical protein